MGLSWLLCGVSDLGLDSTSTTIHQNARELSQAHRAHRLAHCPGRPPAPKPGRTRARANRRETAARRTNTGADHSPTGTPAPLERG